MKYQTCNCTLPDLNPEACKACSVWQHNQIADQGIPFSPFNPPYQPEPTPWIPIQPGTGGWQVQQTKRIKRITRTIERYDEMGNYKGKEVITEDHEDVDVPDYKYGWTITTGAAVECSNPGTAGTQYNAGVSTDTVTLKKDTPFTYTAGNTGDRHVDSVLNGMNVISGQVVSNLANSACCVNATRFFN